MPGKPKSLFLENLDAKIGGHIIGVKAQMKKAIYFDGLNVEAFNSKHETILIEQLLPRNI